MPAVIRQKIVPRPTKDRLRYQRGIILREDQIDKEKIFPRIPLEVYQQKAMFAEPTGRGTDLIIDTKFGRMFLSDYKAVQENLEAFVDLYKERCRRYDEDPAHEYIEPTNYNELYVLQGLIPSIVGNESVFFNTKEYRVDLEFDQGWVEDGPWVNRFKTPYYYFCPYEHCSPGTLEYYMEETEEI